MQIVKDLRILADAIEQRTCEHQPHWKVWTYENFPPVVQKWYDESMAKGILCAVFIPDGEMVPEFVSQWSLANYTPYSEETEIPVDGGVILIRHRGQ